MNAKTMLDILSAPPRTEEETAIDILKAAEDSSAKSLEDAFAIALGVGKLDERAAQKLLSALERLFPASTLEECDFWGDPEIESLKKEVAELLGRRQQLHGERRVTLELRDEISALQSLCEEARLKRDALSGESERTQSELDRLGRIEGELQQ